MTKLNLDPSRIDSCRRSAARVADSVMAFARERSTVSVERAVLRLMGVAGANSDEVPHVNRIVTRLSEAGWLRDGAAIHVGQLAVKHSMPLPEVLRALVDGTVHFSALDPGLVPAAREFAFEACARQWKVIKESSDRRAEARNAQVRSKGPLAYVLTATGDVYEDVRHAEAVAQHGGDIVAVIRSTAQSLLDYVPFGPTREGYGGTYATQENFRIMRKALDEWTKKNGRYVRLSSFCSGLCMPEIAAMGAIEGLDNMVNDALYGILYRDINMERTLVDQAFSRAINGAAGIVINTGEDNYLRTADPLKAAPSVVVSQMINHEMARLSGLESHQIAVGNAFELPPDTENSLLLEWAHALLTRELFPDCPVKYMPPTRFMDGNLFRTHACDTLFNLVTVGTQQGIQTIGVPTEGIFTPHIQDRVLALECVNYVKTAAKDLHAEIEFAENGIVKTRARQVLHEAEQMLVAIGSGKDGLFGAIERGMFGDVHRSRKSGKGSDGVFVRGDDYVNPFESMFIQTEASA